MNWVALRVGFNILVGNPWAGNDEEQKSIVTGGGVSAEWGSILLLRVYNTEFNRRVPVSGGWSRWSLSFEQSKDTWQENQTTVRLIWCSVTDHWARAFLVHPFWGHSRIYYSEITEFISGGQRLQPWGDKNLFQNILRNSWHFILKLLSIPSPQQSYFLTHFCPFPFSSLVCGKRV